MLAVIGLVALLVGILTLSAYLQNRTKESPFSLNPTPDYEQVTQLGNVMDGASISPDGKYVAYVTTESGKRTVWVRQLAANSSVALVKDDFAGGQGQEPGLVSFSPDSQCAISCPMFTSCQCSEANLAKFFRTSARLLVSPRTDD
jgi:hypothetical protein